MSATSLGQDRVSQGAAADGNLKAFLPQVIQLLRLLAIQLAIRVERS